MKLIGYIRVSTEEQSREGVSMAVQTEKIRQYSQLQDHELVAIIQDAGLSAKNIKGRPRFQAALGRILAGESDGLVVWKLDRAFRSTRDALDVAESLNKNGKALISISETLDTSSAIGEFFFTLMASLAQMERRMIGERTSAALQSKKTKGERVGEIPFGFDLAPDGVSLIESKPEKAMISRIIGKRKRGCKFRAIAADLNSKKLFTKKGRPWSHVQVARICRTAAC